MSRAVQFTLRAGSTSFSSCDDAHKTKAVVDVRELHAITWI